MPKQRPQGTPIGNLANSMISDYWNRFNTSGEFMPPGLPPPVQAKVSRPRIWDYSPLFNMMQGLSIGVEPEGKDATDYDINEIRRFADEHEITRLAIETCKDQICKLEGFYRLKPKPGQSKEEVREASEKDERCQELNDFFESPDKEYDMPEWTRILFEEILVTDMVPIWKQETLIGTPYAIHIIDTATIVRLVNDMGLTPTPDEPYPANIAYQQKIKGLITSEFTSDEMIYFIRNPRAWAFFGYSPVEQIILTLATGMQRMAFQLSHYTEGNIPAMFMRAPKEWGLEQIKEWQLYWNELLSGNLGELSKGFLIPGDFEPVFPQKEALKDDYDEWVARVVSNAFSLSPNVYIKNLNRATSEQAREQADEEGLQTRVKIRNHIMNKIQRKWWGYKDIEYHTIYDRPQDSKKQAEIDNMDVRNGLKSVDEVRRERGLNPIGAPNRIYTNNGFIPLTKGDEGRFDVFQQKLITAGEEEEDSSGKEEGKGVTSFETDAE